MGDSGGVLCLEAARRPVPARMVPGPRLSAVERRPTRYIAGERCPCAYSRRDRQPATEPTKPYKNKNQVNHKYDIVGKWHTYEESNNQHEL